MGRRRRNGLLDFLDGFNSGFDAVGKASEALQLSDISSQAPEKVAEASGEEAYQAGLSALKQAQAANPEQADQIAQSYAPTMAGLEKIRTAPAGEHYSMGTGKNFTQFDHAPSDGEQTLLKANQAADVVAARDPYKAMQLRGLAAYGLKSQQELEDQAAIRRAWSAEPGLQKASNAPVSQTEGTIAQEPSGAALAATPDEGTPTAQAKPVSTAMPLDRSEVQRAEQVLQNNATRPAAASYLQTKAPAIIDAYLKQGKVEEAKRLRDFADSEEGRAYTHEWSHGVRRLSQGDYQGAIKHWENLYNSQGFPDGRTVTLKPSEDGKIYQADWHDKDGNVTNSVTRNTADLARQAGMALAPEKMAELMTSQQSARDRDSASLERQEHLENLRFERSQMQEDRRDARLQRNLDARAGGGGMTPAQQRTNDSIVAARRQLTGMTRDEILRLTQPTTATGRVNDEYDPQLARAAKLANTRLYGDDPAHDAFTQPAPQRATGGNGGDLQTRFSADPSMKGKRMGKQTDRGTEVFDASGRLVGHYR